MPDVYASRPAAEPGAKVTVRKTPRIGHDARGRFAEGNSGGGRPKGSLSLRTRLGRNLFAPETTADAAGVLLALLDDPEARIRLEASRLALAYGLGAPRARVDVAFDLPVGVAAELRLLARLSVEELEAVARGESGGDDA